MEKKTIKINNIELFYSCEDRMVEYVAYRYIVKDDHYSQMLGSQPFLFYFLKPESSFYEDKIIFKYTLPNSCRKMDAASDLTRQEKLRLCMNTAYFTELFKTRMIPLLHPANIVFDENLVPKMMYCGLKNILEPTELDENDYLLRYKCFIISMFEGTDNFEKLYESDLFSVKSNAFAGKIKKLETLEEVVEFLRQEYQKEEEEIKKEKTLVRKKVFKTYKVLTAIMTTLALLLGSLAIYMGFGLVPYKNRMTDSAEAFIRQDYKEVIRILDDDSVGNLPTLNKYILAYSFVYSENLSTEQKTNIFNNISLISSSEYLEFWIYVGRGEYDTGLDIGKSLGDNQLILMALAKQLEYVQSNSELSGQEKEEQTNAINQQIEEYRERLYSSGEDEDSGGASGD